jgi:hypothetical protein
MSNIQFEEGYNQVNAKYYNNASGDRGMVAWLIKKGIVKDEKTAQIVLLVVAVICFGLAFYLMTKNSGPASNPNTLNNSSNNIQDILNARKNAPNN